jgi:hypothetical protein
MNVFHQTGEYFRMLVSFAGRAQAHDDNDLPSATIVIGTVSLYRSARRMSLGS